MAAPASICFGSGSYTEQHSTKSAGEPPNRVQSRDFQHWAVETAVILEERPTVCDTACVLHVGVDQVVVRIHYEAI